MSPLDKLRCFWGKQLLICLNKKKKKINLKRVVQALGSTKVAAVPSLHVPSGADIAGSFAGKGTGKDVMCQTSF